MSPINSPFKNITYLESFHFGHEIYPHELYWDRLDKGYIQDSWKKFVTEEKVQAKERLLLHVNIPFCETHCAYCTHAIDVRKWSNIGLYLKQLSRDMESYSQIFQWASFSSLYLWGGTPTLLSEEQLEQLFDKIQSLFHVKDASFVMMEFSPATATEEKVKIAKDRGINRVTFGIQDIHEEVLKKNARLQTKEQVKNLIGWLKKYEMPYINVDIMAWLPFQTFEHFRETLDFVQTLPVNDICLNVFKPTEKVPGKNLISYDEVYLAERNKMVEYWRNTYSHKEENLVEEAERVDLYPFDNPNISTLGLWYGANSRISWRLVYQASSLSGYTGWADEYRGFPITMEDEIIKYLLLRLKESGICYREIQLLFWVSTIPDRITKGIETLKGKWMIDTFEKEGQTMLRFRPSSELMYQLYSKIFYSDEVLKMALSKAATLTENTQINQELKKFFIS